MVAVIFKVVKVTWLAVAFAILIIELFVFDDRPGWGSGILTARYMLALSFPSGLVVPWTHVLLDEVFSIYFELSREYLFLVWLCFFITGYWQWFKLTPYFAGRIRGFIKSKDRRGARRVERMEE